MTLVSGKRSFHEQAAQYHSSGGVYVGNLAQVLFEV